MSGGLAQRYANVLVEYSRYVLVAMVVATVAMGVGAGDVESGLTIAGFASDSTEARKLDYVQSNFSTDGENTTVVQVVIRDGNALSKESLLASLRFQRAIRNDPEINATLSDRRPTAGLANLVAVAAIRAETARGRPGTSAGGPPGGSGGGGPGENASRAPPGNATGGTAARAGRRPTPTLSAQIDQLQSMSETEVRETTARVLDPDRGARLPVDPYALLPTDYDGGQTAEARVLTVFQTAEGDGEQLPSDVATAQLAIRDVVDRELPGESFAFGAGIVDERAGQATGQSFAVITPVALLFILVVLLVAYRDLADVALGLLGAALVLVWMGGFMGWAGIGVTQIIIAVPFLLVGLSIDYALHVVMRYREAREDDPDRSVREGMRVGLSGVVVALGATTFTTSVGFLSNGVSPIGSIREFGLVSAAGIVSAFLVFAVLLPTIKVELDALLERLGLDRRKRAFGTGGVSNRLLSVGTAAARRAPVAVVVVALLVSAGGGFAATKIDTSIDRVDFLPRDSPAWMDSLPGPLRPDDYSLRENAVYLNDRFVQSNDRTRAEILVEGSVTDPGTLDRLAAGRDRVRASETPVTLANGEPKVEGPLSAINDTAAENATVAAVVERNDDDGDGIPDRNLEAVYDAVYAAAPDRAAAVLYREDGQYRALRQSVILRGGADTATVTAEMRAVASAVEGDSGLTVTATGRPIVDEIVQKGLLRTLVETFLITLGVVLAFLTAVFYRRYGTLSLGAVTMVPVVFALAWILGAMYLLSIPFNTETAIIASIAIGIGVDYAIHVSERFVEELHRTGGTYAALDATVAGTGGALLASAVSTAGGFGVLLFALVPSLQRFGLVTGTAIVFAFVSSVLVLPSLLALWQRYLGTAGTAHDDTAGVDATGAD